MDSSLISIPLMVVISVACAEASSGKTFICLFPVEVLKYNLDSSMMKFYPEIAEAFSDLISNCSPFFSILIELNPVDTSTVVIIGLVSVVGQEAVSSVQIHPKGQVLPGHEYIGQLLKSTSPVGIPPTQAVHA